MSSPVYKYRYYCTTEATYVYKWDTTTPTVCPNNNGHTINSASITIIDTRAENTTTVVNLPTSAFDEVRVVERSKILELKSIAGLNSLRNIFTQVGTGTITNNYGDGIYVLSVSGANDRVVLQSSERGKYAAGLQGEVGIGCRLPLTTLTGNQFIRIGLFDSNNGFYFKKTASGLSVCVLRAGVETSIPRAQWNVDTLDGNGPSGLVLDETYGIIWRIIFTWYGYGSINFNVNVTHPVTLIQNNYLVHTYNPTTLTSVTTPNLPVSVELNNNGTSGTHSSHVAGRQYSLLGKYQPLYRTLSHFVTNITINSSTTFLPVLSMRRKADFIGVPIKLMSVDAIATRDMIVQIKVNTTLTGASFGNLIDISAADTAAEVDTSATSISNTGIPIYTALVDGSNTSVTTNLSDLAFDLPDSYIVTVSARAVSGGLLNGVVSVVLRWGEEW
jgi:hypothetical protein